MALFTLSAIPIHPKTSFRKLVPSLAMRLFGIYGSRPDASHYILPSRNHLKMIWPNAHGIAAKVIYVEISPG